MFGSKMIQATLAIMITLCALTGVSMVLAQGGGHRHGYGGGQTQGMCHCQCPGCSQKARQNYDLASEVTVIGTVEVVTSLQGRGYGSGTHVTLKTSTGNIEVHFGPARYLEREKFTLAKGDQIEVKGAKKRFGTMETITARIVKKGEQTLTLRDEQGFPMWSGRYRH